MLPGQSGCRLSRERIRELQESSQLTCGSLWEGISSEKRELLRGFLRYVQSDISKLSRPGSRFDFRNGSIGNFFLTGARLVRFPPFVRLIRVLRIFRSLHLSAFLNILVAGNNHRPTHNKYQPQHTYRC